MQTRIVHRTNREMEEATCAHIHGGAGVFLSRSFPNLPCSCGHVACDQALRELAKEQKVTLSGSVCNKCAGVLRDWCCRGV